MTKYPTARRAAMRAFACGAGFTLIELMVVLVIIGVLAALIVPNVLERADDARTMAARTDVNNLMQALKLYKLDNQRYPSAEQGLAALVGKPDQRADPAQLEALPGQAAQRSLEPALPVPEPGPQGRGRRVVVWCRRTGRRRRQERRCRLLAIAGDADCQPARPDSRCSNCCWWWPSSPWPAPASVLHCATSARPSSSARACAWWPCWNRRVRARAPVGVPVYWRATDSGFELHRPAAAVPSTADPTPAASGRRRHSRRCMAWLTDGVSVPADTVLTLGPEPLIARQDIVLVHGGQRIHVRTDGLRAFARAWHDERRCARRDARQRAVSR